MIEMETKTGERTLSGRVTSARMDKTVAVVIERTERHPVYGKFLRRRTKLLAHDETNECREGDRVKIASCRPLSRRKSWRVVAVIERFDPGVAVAPRGGEPEEVTA